MGEELKKLVVSFKEMFLPCKYSFQSMLPADGKPRRGGQGLLLLPSSGGCGFVPPNGLHC